MTCSFHTPEPGQPVHQLTVPKLPPSHYKAKQPPPNSSSSDEKLGSGDAGRLSVDVSATAIASLVDPYDCLPNEDRIAAQLASNDRLPVKVREYLTRAMDERRQSSIEIRPLDPEFNGVWNDYARKREPTRAVWMRSRAPVKRDHRFQKCVLAYASDYQFISTASGALGLGSRTNPRLSMISSVSLATRPLVSFSSSFSLIPFYVLIRILPCC
jgi:acyl-CoA thioesterase 8